MSNVYLIAEIQAAAGQAENVSALLQDLVAASQAETGCITYELYQDTTTEGLFVVREIWQSTDALAEHEQSVHFQNFVTTTQDNQLTTSLLVRPLTPVV
ncbi:putative quinol monooxygenase [Vibrio mangrovi]|uniref:Putative monooxygenase YcnE n=1 Tax=Vibrio mangrovi TaxID=474394 RepID=A0A1Y6IW48_9VIBR|nr:putative quinol monooxygenase [Vibrio mangrovi]MDW6005078.1 putative quinol monooxygenase [Vibrio mangrovi]SMS01846.1 Putative monooxygenase YcnE [Vibrio mangrovi]